MWCFVKQQGGVRIPQSVQWLCSCKAVLHLLSGLPVWRAPVKAFSIDCVVGSWISVFWSLRERRRESIAAFHRVNAKDRCALKLFCSGNFEASPTGQLQGFHAATPLGCGRKELVWRLVSWSKMWKMHSFNSLARPEFQTVWVWLSGEYCNSHLVTSQEHRRADLTTPCFSS